MAEYHGLLPVFKPAGMTSHDVIYRLRKIFDQQKIGHTGTLDPMAQGLLIILLGKATKLTRFFSDWDKAYDAQISLGYTSDTLDADGELTPAGPVRDFSETELNGVIEPLVGRIRQRVPLYSAVKKNGKELYKYARQGKAVEQPEREVDVYSMVIREISLPFLMLSVECSKGTYIRALADEIGAALGCGGYLSALTRTASGRFTIDQARTLDDLQEACEHGTLQNCLSPIEDILDFPVVQVSDKMASQVPYGSVPCADDVVDLTAAFESGQYISMANRKGDILAIGKSCCSAYELSSRETQEFFSYVRVLI